MTHNQVYKTFVKMFPIYANDNLVYFPNGKNSIRIRGIQGFFCMKTQQDIIFSCNNDCSEWKLETLDNFIKSMKEGIKSA